ncbi:MAG: hypothetical protein R2941_20520 [Desulfobacterales bacterium]
MVKKADLSVSSSHINNFPSRVKHSNIPASILAKSPADCKKDGPIHLFQFVFVAVPNRYWTSFQAFVSPDFPTAGLLWKIQASILGRETGVIFPPIS